MGVSELFHRVTLSGGVPLKRVIMRATGLAGS